ncbi:helix-turn-helix domain-containing protein [Methanolobus sp. ZRKC3]|uniref:TrmB family transcriptional regulator n=1 Tax=Methanolobus sp. ZRKC3 TaxID=3125786 RepID=UPI003253B944
MLLESLQNIGFTSYEAKVFVSLVKNKDATVATLHLDSGVPNSAIYGALKKLEKKGMIQLQNAKPIRYKCTSPEVAVSKLKRDFEDECEKILDQLEQIYDTSFDDVHDEDIWTIKGVRNVVDKIIQLIEGANEDILILSSSTPFNNLADNDRSLKKDYLNIMHLFNKKSAHGVKVRFISSSEDEASRMCKVVPLASIKVNDPKEQLYGLKSFTMLVDNSETLLAIIKEDGEETGLTAMWTHGKEFSHTMSHLLNAQWEVSDVYHSDV